MLRDRRLAGRTVLINAEIILRDIEDLNLIEVFSTQIEHVDETRIRFDVEERVQYVVMPYLSKVF
jgi:hypothetical protein